MFTLIFLRDFMGLGDIICSSNIMDMTLKGTKVKDLASYHKITHSHPPLHTHTEHAQHHDHDLKLIPHFAEAD